MRRFGYLLAASLLAAVPLEAQQFGSSAAIDEDALLIGQPVNDDAPGAVLIFRREGDEWVEAGRLTGPEAEKGDYFGRVILLSRDELIVTSTAMEESTGAAYVYHRGADGTWEQTARLRPDSIEQGDAFGRRAVLEGDRLYIASLGHRDGAGAVFVYGRDAWGDWVYESRVMAEEPQASDFLGWGLAARGDQLLVTAPQLRTPEGMEDRGGRAFIFNRQADGTWSQEAEFGFEDREEGGFFGLAAAWLGELAVVAAPNHNNRAGLVYTYRQNRRDEWVEGPKLSAFDANSRLQFGRSLRSVDSELWVGAPNADGGGRVYRFSYDPDAGEFEAAKKIAGYDLELGDGFGEILATSETLALIGALRDDFGLGSAHVLERDEGAWVARAKLIGDEPEPLANITGGEVSCEEGKADQFDCNEVGILSFLSVAAIGGGRGAEVNDVWGWTDPETVREYALVGRTDGTAFVDVTDPQNPVYLGNLPKTAGSPGSTWRDIKVYKDHAFIVADGAGDHGMQVFNLTQLRDVRDAPVTFQETAHYDRINSAHNIVINEASGFAYGVGGSAGGETCGGGLHMIDIHEPTRPTFMGCFNDPETGQQNSPGYSHDALCIIYNGPDAEHVGKEICFGSNETALSIADVSDKENPVALSSATYPNVGYAHQGWVTEDHKYFFMDDEGDEFNNEFPGTRTLIWDIQDLDDPVLAKEYFGTTFTSDHNLYIKGNLMYQSNYVSGLRILDISDPENPREVGFLDTVPGSEEPGFDGSWSNYPYFESGTLLVSSQKEGIFFLKYREPALLP